MFILVALALAQADSIDRLIERLGSEEIEARDKASAALRKSGEAAIPALRKALRFPDAEIRGRARDVLGALGIEVVALKGVDPSGLAKLLGDLFQGDQTVNVAFESANQAVIFRGQDGFLKAAKEVVSRIDQDAVESAGRLDASSRGEVVFQDSRVSKSRPSLFPEK